jgi:hypothetical protein
MIVYKEMDMEGSSHGYGLIFKVISQHLLAGIEKTRENLGQDSWCPG